MKITLIAAAAGFAALQLSAAPVDWSQLPPAATVTGVTFDQDIAPILQTSCVRCHGAERPRAQLRLDSLAGVLKGTKQGPILTPGDSANSLLVKAVSRLDPETAMPPNRRPPRPMGTNAPPMQAHDGGSMAGGPPAEGGNGPQGTNAPPRRPLGPPAKPLTADQVGLIRAWIDQGAK